MQFTKILFPHQEREWLADRDREWHAITWDQGTGKTLLTLLVAQWLYLRGEIDAVLVIAPSGVHHNWVSDEVPGSVPEGLMQATAYTTKRAATKWHQRAIEATVSQSFPLLGMSYDAVNTPKGYAAAERFLKARRCMFVLDEAHYIAGRKSKRTARLMKLREHARYRRILTGTPMPDNPLNEYMLYEWLCPGFWKERGFPNETVYDHYFAVMRRFQQEGARWHHWSPVAYRHLDELREHLAPHSSRVLKSEVLRHLPPKVYMRRYYDMTAEQQRTYDKLRTDMFAEVGGTMVSVDRSGTLVQKLQQVLCGFFYDVTGETILLDKNPRLDLLTQLVRDTPGPALIWAFHRVSVRQIVERLRAMGKSVCHYYGETDEEERQRAKHGFQNGTFDYFVGNPGSGAGTGHTLTRAQYQVYYSNSFKWVHRVQSEDRVHRIGLEHNAVIYDLVGRTSDGKPTMDERSILKKLEETAKTAAFLTGDDLRRLIA